MHSFAAALINDAMPESMSELEGGGERRRKTLTRVCTHFTHRRLLLQGRERGREGAHAHTWMDLVSARGKCETCADDGRSAAAAASENRMGEREAVFPRPSPTPTYSALIEICNGIALKHPNKRMTAKKMHARQAGSAKYQSQCVQQEAQDDI